MRRFKFNGNPKDYLDYGLQKNVIYNGSDTVSSGGSMAYISFLVDTYPEDWEEILPVNHKMILDIAIRIFSKNRSIGIKRSVEKAKEMVDILKDIKKEEDMNTMDASRFLGVSSQQINSWVKSRKIDYYVESGKVFFRKDVLDKFKNG